MSRWTRILTLLLLPVAAVALGGVPAQDEAPARKVDSQHKKKSNPSAEHGTTSKPAPGADASLNPQPIPPGKKKSGLARRNASTRSAAADGSNVEARDTGTKSARRKSATTSTDGSSSELRDTGTKTARRKSATTNANGELRDPSSRKTSKTKLNTDGEIRHPSSKKSSATSSRENGNDKGIIFVGGKKTQKPKKTHA